MSFKCLFKHDWQIVNESVPDHYGVQYIGTKNLDERVLDMFNKIDAKHQNTNLYSPYHNIVYVDKYRCDKLCRTCGSVDFALQKAVKKSLDLFEKLSKARQDDAFRKTYTNGRVSEFWNLNF